MRRKVALAILAVVLVVLALIAWRARGDGAGGAHGDGSAGGSRDDTSAAALAAGRRTIAPPRAPASLGGRVTRAADGAGIAGATVAIARAEMASLIGVAAPPLLATTDGDGAWRAPAVPPGTYVVSASAAGYMPNHAPRLALAPGEARTDVAIALVAGGTLVRGTVSDVVGGPISGAHVLVGHDDPLDFGHGTAVVTTGADGTYQIALRDGDYELRAEHDAYAPETRDVAVAGAPLVVDFTLTPGGGIRGQVVTRDTHKPVPRALLFTSMSGSSRDGGQVRATSDDDGNFALASLRPGVVSITAAALGYASAAPTSVELGIGEQVSGVRVVVDRAFTIAGTVVATDGKRAISGATVGASSMSNGGQAQTLDPTGDDGAFALLGVKPGSYILFAFAEDKIPSIGKTVQVVDRDVTGVELALDAGISLAGHVEPRGAATIGLELADEVGLGNVMQAVKTMLVHADADATGEFTLQHVPDGALRLTARTTEGPAGSLLVTVAGADQRGLVVTLGPRAAIAGRVVDTHHAPVSGAHVSARATDHESSMDFSGGTRSRPNATTGADGAFRLVGLDAGRYDLVASRDGAGDSDGDDALDKDGKPAPVTIDVGSGADKTGVVITLQARDGVIRGKVLAGDGEPAADAWVSARKELGTGAGSGSDASDAPWQPTTTPTLTDESGAFTVKGLAPGTYTLIAEGPRGSSRGQTAHVEVGASATIQLAALGTLSGHVTLRATPVTTYSLTCNGPVEVDRTIYATDGGYALEHLAPGSYRCDVSGDDGTAHGNVDVPAAAATLDFALAPWATLTGTAVSMFDGTPVPGITAATGDDRSIGDIVLGTAPVSDAAGRFTLTRVADGGGIVSLYDPSSGGVSPLATQSYTAASGQQVDVGAMKIVPPRKGSAGTFGLSVSDNLDALLVTAVKPGGPAATAGIAAGDVVRAIDGQPVAALGVTQCVRYLASGSIGVGQSVSLTMDKGNVVTITSVAW